VVAAQAKMFLVPHIALRARVSRDFTIANRTVTTDCFRSSHVVLGLRGVAYYAEPRGSYRAMA
jgi:hypothetical protein